MSERAEECGKCRFWVAMGEDDRGDDEGMCHRYPPHSLQGNAAYQGDFGYPLTSPNDWCGEFVQREQAKGGEARR